MWIDAFYGGIPLPKNMSAKKLARLENDMEFLNTFADMFNSALNVFKWNGLPETCNERFLERSLLMRGSALIVKEGDKVYDETKNCALGNVVSVEVGPSVNYGTDSSGNYYYAETYAEHLENCKIAGIE